MASAAKKTPAAPKAAAKKTPAAPKAPKAPKEPVVKAPKIEQNGVTRPKDGSVTGQVWAIADEITKSKKGEPATRAEVFEKATAKPYEINEATVATQFQRWRTFFGVERKAAAPKAPKAPKAGKAAAATA